MSAGGRAFEWDGQEKIDTIAEHGAGIAPWDRRLPAGPEEAGGSVSHPRAALHLLPAR